MAAVACTFVKRIPIGGAVAGALVIEVWKVPASTDADTQTLALPHIKTVLAIVGPLEMVAQTVDRSIDVITIATVDASNFTHALIIGTE
jgi:hypothetical protein